MTIGQRIKKRRIELGLSADDLAKKLNKNRATIYRYESDEIEKLPTNVLEPLCNVLCTTPAKLMGWEEKAPPTSEDDEQLVEMFSKLEKQDRDYILKFMRSLVDSQKDE